MVSMPCAISVATTASAVVICSGIFLAVLPGIRMCRSPRRCREQRDHSALTQVVADPDSPAFKTAEKLRAEWVVRIDGKVRPRPEGTVNPELPTGEVEVYISEIQVLGRAGELP